MSNGAIIYSSHVGELDLPTLRLAARIAHVFLDLASDSATSYFRLANFVMQQDSVKIEFEGDTVLTGSCSPMTRLWHTPIPPSNQTRLATGYANAAKLSATPAELVAFAHAALGSPALSTLSTALDKNYVSRFSGLIAKSLRKYPPPSIAMAKGHLDQTRKKQHPTKTPVKPPTSSKLEEPDEFFPDSPDSGARTHLCYAACAEEHLSHSKNPTMLMMSPSHFSPNMV